MNRTGNVLRYEELIENSGRSWTRATVDPKEKRVREVQDVAISVASLSLYKRF